MYVCTIPATAYTGDVSVVGWWYSRQISNREPGSRHLLPTLSPPDLLGQQCLPFCNHRNKETNVRAVRLYIFTKPPIRWKHLHTLAAIHLIHELAIFFTSYSRIVTCLILSVCRGNLAFKCKPSRGYGCAFQPRTGSNWIKMDRQPWSFCNREFMFFFIFPLEIRWNFICKNCWFVGSFF